jgi:hypothetical protein
MRENFTTMAVETHENIGILKGGGCGTERAEILSKSG